MKILRIGFKEWMLLLAAHLLLISGCANQVPQEKKEDLMMSTIISIARNEPMSLCDPKSLSEKLKIEMALRRESFRIDSRLENREFGDVKIEGVRVGSSRYYRSQKEDGTWSCFLHIDFKKEFVCEISSESFAKRVGVPVTPGREIPHTYVYALDHRFPVDGAVEFVLSFGYSNQKCATGFVAFLDKKRHYFLVIKSD